MNIMTKLIEAIEIKNSPTVIGLDTTISMIPETIKKRYIQEYGKTAKSVSHMLLDYNKLIIDATHDIVPAVKVQIAMYEEYGLEGLWAYDMTTAYAKEKGLVVIGDIKRGDIGSTANSYAAHLSGVKFDDTKLDTWNEDMITINPYLGSDGLKPFSQACIENDKACFVLVKTSNPSSSEIQDLISKEHGKPIYEVVGDIVSNLGSDQIDKYGYSYMGAVVGATHGAIGEQLRKNMPHTFFLVPGYGAQGARAEDLAGFFDKEGRGSIVNSSRGIIANWQKENRFCENNIGDAAREATQNMNKDITKVIK